MKGYITRGRVNGTWYLRVELPRSADGKRQQRRETIRGTKADASRRLRAFLTEVESGGHADGTRITFGNLAERWLTTIENRVGARTFASYRAHVRLYIVPALGNVRADALRPPLIEKALSSWATGARNDRERGQLSQRTVAHIFNTLRSTCRWAVKMGLLLRNPVESVDSPRVDRREMRALDAAGNFGAARRRCWIGTRTPDRRRGWHRSTSRRTSCPPVVGYRRRCRSTIGAAVGRNRQRRHPNEAAEDSPQRTHYLAPFVRRFRPSPLPHRAKRAPPFTRAGAHERRSGLYAT